VIEDRVCTPAGCSAAVTKPPACARGGQQAAPAMARRASSGCPSAMATASGRGGLRAWRFDPLRDDLALGMTVISESQLSRVCEEIERKVKAFLSRPDRGRLAVPVDRCDLREGMPEQTHRLARGDHSGRRQL
jgi:hypothetical protein